MARNAGRCPNCGEPVSHFAAGCAICGEDLVAARAAAAQTRRPAFSLPRIDDDAVRIVVAVLGVLFAPFIGALLAGWFAYEADRDGRTAFRNGMIALVVLAVVMATAVFQGPFVGH